MLTSEYSNIGIKYNMVTFEIYIKFFFLIFAIFKPKINTSNNHKW